MTSKPKVLMFIDWYLPGYRAGGPIRSCANLVEHFGDEVQFYIVTSDTDYQSETPYPDIIEYGWNKSLKNSKVMYVSKGNLNEELLKKLSSEIEYDFVYIHGLFSTHFSILTHRFFRKQGKPIILAPRGMLRRSALNLKSWKKRPYLILARLLGWYSKTIFHATDDQESRDIQRHFGGSVEIRVAPNLPKLSEESPRSISKQSGKLKLLFAGRIAPEKNLEWGLQLLRNSGLTGIELHIYGAVYDEHYLNRCKAIVEELEDRMFITFNDPVPAQEVGSLIADHHALFLPTRGENFGHIILESFMARRPVFISTETPWRDLMDLGVGYDIPLTNDTHWIQRLQEMHQMSQDEFDIICEKAHAYFFRYSNDEELIGASKALFLPSE